MKIQNDCFFYIDSSDSDEEKTILARCTDCHKEDDEGWFWEGSKKGYSLYEIKCSICGKIIHKNEEENQKN